MPRGSAKTGPPNGGSVYGSALNTHTELVQDLVQAKSQGAYNCVPPKQFH